MLLGYFQFLHSIRYVGYVACSAFYFCCLFAFIAGSPFVYIDYFGIPPQYYGFLFGVNMLGMIASTFVNSRIVVRRGMTAARGQLVVTVGGSARTRVVLLLACVLALASADSATVGASAVELRRTLDISNTDIGLLVSVTAVVAAVFSLPFGVLADRGRRTWILSGALVTWGAAMLWSATASSFGQLLLARVGLGAVTAAAGPIVASLVGDWFPAAERGRIYGYILTGELLGAGAGFAVTGDIAALSWRAAFILLAET